MLRKMAVLIGVVAVSTLTVAPPAGAAPQVKQKSEHAAKKTGEVITDAAITSEVKTKLLAAKGVPGSQINVDTANGVVTLKGTVPSSASRAKAIRIARHSKGVKRVVSQLTIGRA